uniref:Sushi domain-containing protein n=1 Tax=Branchiostoma floridae TaxID=7739 RepID=C3ZG23_BRAFL|eukprot:XP_002592487.1 hypothetical protein BRAFLDRAFT_68978 [Branchiostoma floridae]
MTWRIEADSDDVVHLKFVRFDLEGIFFCLWDYVVVHGSINDPVNHTVPPEFDKHCKGLNFDWVTFPNFYGHESDQDVLTSRQWEEMVSVNISCHPQVQRFLCALLMPRWLAGSKQLPCQSWCQEVRSACSSAATDWTLPDACPFNTTECVNLEPAEASKDESSEPFCFVKEVWDENQTVVLREPCGLMPCNERGRGCGVPPVVVSGSRSPVYNFYRIGDHVDISCDVGFSMEEEDMWMTCIGNENWSKTNPTCKVDHRLLLAKTLLHPKRYNPELAPSRNQVNVTFEGVAVDIIDADAKNEDMFSAIAFRLHWTDNRLSWTSKQNDNVRNISVSRKRVWTPKVYLHPKFGCAENVTEFKPLIESFMTCDSDGRADVVNQWWAKWKVNVKDGLACINMTFDRNPTADFCTTLSPVIILSVLMCIIFVLPVEKGDRLSFGMTILLSMVVSLVFISDVLPTKGSMPVIGKLVIVYMCMMGVFVIYSLIVIRISSRKKDLPPVVKKVFLGHLARLVFLGDLTKPTRRPTVVNVHDIEMVEGLMVKDSKPSEAEPESVEVLLSLQKSINALSDAVESLGTSGQPQTTEASKDAAPKTDYHQLVKVLDRLCLALYVFGLIIAIPIVRKGTCGTNPHDEADPNTPTDGTVSTKDWDNSRRWQEYWGRCLDQEAPTYAFDLVGYVCEERLARGFFPRVNVKDGLACINMTFDRNPTADFCTTLSPVIILSVLMCIIFVLPVDKGDRLSFGMTILLSMVVSLVFISDVLPTKGSMPVIGKLVIVYMCMMGVFVIYSLIVIRISSRVSLF